MSRLVRALGCASVIGAALSLQAASAQCTGPFTGGVIPAVGSGGGGAFPGTLPPSPSIFTGAVTVPSGATVLKSVKLNNLTHTWSGDVQFFLESPAQPGVLHNLICGMPLDPGNDFGGNYELVDPIQGNPCAGGFPTFNYANGDPITGGTYTQNFNGFAGPATTANTPLEQIPIASGNWNLYAFDWVGGDTGNLTTWELCFGTPTVPPPPPPPPYPTSSQCVTGGVGGSYPTAGVDGTWPTTLPTGGLVSTASITVPAGSTKVVMVKLIGWSHTWSTDSMVVLTDPAGGQHLIFQGDNGSLCGGCGDDFNGDYEFVDLNVGGGNPCTGGNPAFPACGVATIAPGRYVQQFGSWPTGSAGINNTPLESIPVSSGNWTLSIYDWCVGFDNGSLTGWDLCFDAPTGPASYCTAGTSFNGCSPTLSGANNLSATFANACSITASGVEGQKSGLLFYGITGRNNVNWCAGGSSLLCVKAPTQRTNNQNSGGTVNACDGTITLNVNNYLQNVNPNAYGTPFVAGNLIQWQCWYRDPPACKTTSLSNGLEMTVQP